MIDLLYTIEEGNEYVLLITQADNPVDEPDRSTAINHLNQAT